MLTEVTSETMEPSVEAVSLAAPVTSPVVVAEGKYCRRVWEEEGRG